MNLKASKTPAFFRSSTLQDLAWGENQNPLYPHIGANASIAPILAELENQFSSEKRNILANVLLRQYKGIDLSSKQSLNIDSLKKDNVFTVVTGQQIHPIMGPFFVWNKIVSTIQTANQLEKKHTDKKFIPIFWMASEDHDFEEISGIPFMGKNYEWMEENGGPVGKLPTKNIVTLLETIQQDFATDEKIVAQIESFKVHYQQFDNLADASRSFMQTYFADSGLLVLDPNEPELKQMFVDVFAREIGTSFFEDFSQQTTLLKENNLPVSVNPRKTHLFYLEDSKRLRIDASAEGFITAKQEMEWTKEALLELAKTSPEKLSPNVLMRPLYQQSILPNVVYVAGPSEFYYWMLTPKAFQTAGLAIPRLQLRASSVILNKGIEKKMQRLKLEMNQIFQTYSVLEDVVLQQYKDDFKLDGAINELKKSYENVWQSLYEIKDPSLKNIKKENEQFLRNLQKISSDYKSGANAESEISTLLQTLKSLKESAFSESNPQERTLYCLEYLVKYGAFPAHSDIDGISEFFEISG